jgi:hypothetical protein
MSLFKKLNIQIIDTNKIFETNKTQYKHQNIDTNKYTKIDKTYKYDDVYTDKKTVYNSNKLRVNTNKNIETNNF